MPDDDLPRNWLFRLWIYMSILLSDYMLRTLVSLLVEGGSRFSIKATAGACACATERSIDMCFVASHAAASTKKILGDMNMAGHDSQQNCDRQTLCGLSCWWCLSQNIGGRCSKCVCRWGFFWIWYPNILNYKHTRKQICFFLQKLKFFHLCCGNVRWMNKLFCSIGNCH